MKYLLVVAMLLNISFAVQLTPMSQKISTDKDRNVLFEVINSSATLAASEFEALRITGHDENGVEIREETENLVVYPPQFIIKEKTSKKVRVSYRKKGFPKKQEVYRIIARELPIKVKEDKQSTKIKAGVKFIFTYEGLLYVGGDDTDAILDVVKVNDSKATLKAKVKNIGNMSSFVFVTTYNIVVRTNKGKVTLDKSYFEKFQGLRILPDESFVFNILKIKKLKGTKVKSITFEKKLLGKK